MIADRHTDRHANHNTYLAESALLSRERGGECVE